MNEQVRGPEWRPEASGSSERNRRAWSVDELRDRLGVAAPEMHTEPARTARKAEPQTMTLERPRIVRRGEAPILA